MDVVVIDYAGQYSVKESYMVMMLENKKKSNGFWSKIWHKVMPSKVSYLVWRMFHNRLPTKENLARVSLV